MSQSHSQQPLRIVICGAGIAGLCTAIGLAQLGLGHDILILERSASLSPVGAGIHVPPNSTLVLEHFGVLDRFAHVATVPKGFTFRRYADSEVLAVSESKNGERKKTKTPYWTMRRCGYQSVLYDIAIQLGCRVRLGQKVVDIVEDDKGEGPVVRIDGEQDIRGDLVIIADGEFS